MELPTSHDYLRMSVEEFDTSKMLAHAAQQRDQRGFDKMLIVDVDAHHYESAAMGEILEYIRDPILRQLLKSARNVGRGGSFRSHRAGLPGHGRAPDPLPAGQARADAQGRQAPRRASVAAVDGRDGHRLHLHVPDADAVARAVAAAQHGERDGACLQLVALRPGAGDGFAHQVDALSAVQRPPRRLQDGQGVRPSEGRDRVHDHDRAQRADLVQRLHEDLRGDRGARRAARLALRVQLGRPDDDQLQPVHHRARARLHLAQRALLHQLDRERDAGEVPEAQGDLDRGRNCLGDLAQPAPRQRVPHALVGVPRPQEAAERIFQGHVSTRRSRWNGPTTWRCSKARSAS